ncbi:MAG: hypothetical protein ABGZ17_14080 [Planctomycetaceae bacterium]
MTRCCPLIGCCILVATVSQAAELKFPPRLPGDRSLVSVVSEEFLKPFGNLKPGTRIARVAPRVDFFYYPGQTYRGNPWSVWGDGLAVGEKYYSAIGDHKGPEGNAFVYEYDAKSRSLSRIVDVRQVLKLPTGHYSPGKIHSRLDMGRDGWLYFSTHRGSTRVTIPKYHYRGDWILRHHPGRHLTEIVAQAPLPNQCLPTSVLDPERLIFYAGTADGDFRNKRVRFLAYDLANRKVLYTDDAGPYRYLIFARSTGRVYFLQSAGRGAISNLVRFDPRTPGPPTRIDARLGLRSASIETERGRVYTVDGDDLWEFNTENERVTHLGPAVVGDQTYITSLDVDPLTQRYLYYIAGAHGGSQHDGSPLVQFDIRTRHRKVIAFLHPYCHAQFGYIAQGTYALAVSPLGDRVYVTWNGNRGTPRTGSIQKPRFNTCALTVIHIPAAERVP